MNERLEHYNFHLAHSPQTTAKIPSYNQIIKPNVYTNTDIIYSMSASGFRQWIVARSGAPTNDFELSFSGQSSLSLDGNGNLNVNTGIGSIVFTRPKAYTLNTTTGALTLLGWQPNYSISSNTVSFVNYGSWSGTLVLEYGHPSAAASRTSITNVDWTTFYGGSQNDQFKDVVCNESNDVFAIGDSESQSILEESGQVIHSHSNLKDMLIVKFNALCQNEFVTYYGGNNEDFGQGIDIDLTTGNL
ncbi:MAG: hypothetical protein IPP69_12475, partial [Flavobacteriales bacterium]|nr:hypothetical protein [Flavobacteriales bacterium]